jgi:hypothetical protein
MIATPLALGTHERSGANRANRKGAGDPDSEALRVKFNEMILAARR